MTAGEAAALLVGLVRGKAYEQNNLPARAASAPDVPSEAAYDA